MRDPTLAKLSHIERTLADIRRTLETLEQILDRGVSLENLLRARGLLIHQKNPAINVLLPDPTDAEGQDRFYHLLKKYSFRLFLRDVIERQQDFEPEALTHYCSLDSAKEYLQALLELGLAEDCGSNHYRLKGENVWSFGGTLEWFIAEIFRREFGAEAFYGVSFRETGVGGDYDVIALWAGKLVYVEVKSSPPRGVESQQVGIFLDRLWDLLPDVAIFFVDTHLRMKDKIVVLFEEEISRRNGEHAEQSFPVRRLQDELFHINHCVYLVNSKPNIASNLQVCLRDHLGYELQRRGMPGRGETLAV